MGRAHPSIIPRHKDKGTGVNSPHRGVLRAASVALFYLEPTHHESVRNTLPKH